MSAPVVVAPAATETEPVGFAGPPLVPPGELDGVPPPPQASVSEKRKTATTPGMTFTNGPKLLSRQDAGPRRGCCLSCLPVLESVMMRAEVPRFSAKTVAKFRSRLLAWYDASRRELPWRDTRDPYKIWISEIMLQQTRVAAVLEYYRRFLVRFPTVTALAKASEADVLAAWSGLGYYRRARALHKAAKVVASDLGGQLPNTPEGLKVLPGIGRYTAAAVSSIAFGFPASVVDGNVERVLSRLFGRDLGGSAWICADVLLDQSRPGDWNQAMMELGATVCLPSDPKCQVCPAKRWCLAPGREVRKQQSSRKQRELMFGLAQKLGSVYLVRRSRRESLMPGMWELPSLEDPNGSSVLHRTRHSITDSDYQVAIVELKKRDARGGKWIPCSKLPELPLTGLARKILHAANLWPHV